MGIELGDHRPTPRPMERASLDTGQRREDRNTTLQTRRRHGAGVLWMASSYRQARPGAGARCSAPLRDTPLAVMERVGSGRRKVASGVDFENLRQELICLRLVGEITISQKVGKPAGAGN